MHCSFVPVVREHDENCKVTGDQSLNHASLVHLLLSTDIKPAKPAAYEIVFEMDTGKIFISNYDGEWVWKWKLQHAPSNP